MKIDNIKRTIIAFLTSICLTFPLSIDAKSISNSDRYLMNEKLINLVSDYELYSTFPGGSDSEYLSLFSEQAVVCCDYFSFRDFLKNNWTPSQYAKCSLSDIVSLRVRIKNIKKQDYVWGNGCWTVCLEFDKEISYVDKNKQFFAVNGGTVDKDIHIIMMCSFSETKNSFYIDSICGEYDGSCRDGLFSIIRKTSNYDEESLLCNGVKLGFTDCRDVVLASGNSSFSTDDEDIHLKCNVKHTSFRYDVLTFNYKPVLFRVKVKGGFAPFAYSISSDIDFDKTRSSAYEFGVDFAYLHRLNNMHRIGFGSGIGLSISSLSMSSSPIEYTLTMSDESFKRYNRTYKIKNVIEGIKFNDIVLPIYMAYECRIGKVVSFAFDAGLKLYLNMATKVIPYEVGGVVEVDYGSGTTVTLIDISGTFDSYMVPVSYARNTYDICAFARTGCDISLNRSLLLSLLIGYEYGVTDSYKSNRSKWFSEESGVYPFIYSNKSHSDQAVRSFADCISYRRHSVWFELGLKFKF